MSGSNRIDLDGLSRGRKEITFVLLDNTLLKRHEHETYLPSLVKSTGTPLADDSVNGLHVHGKSSGAFEELAMGVSSTFVTSLCAACFRFLPFFGVSDIGGFCTPCVTGVPLAFDAAIAGVESTASGTGTGIAAPNRVTLQKNYTCPKRYHLIGAHITSVAEALRISDLSEWNRSRRVY